MSITRLVAAAAIVVPCSAFATNQFNVTDSSCSGSLVSSFANGVSLTCDGNYSLSGGLIESDQSIFLSATGSLSLLDITLRAQTISLNAGEGALAIGDRTGLEVQGHDVVLSSNAGTEPAVISVGPGAAISLSGHEVFSVQPDLDVHLIPWSTFDVATGRTVQFPQPGTIQLSVVPEPRPMALFLGSLLSAGLVMTRKRKKS